MTDYASFEAMFCLVIRYDLLDRSREASFKVLKSTSAAKLLQVPIEVQNAVKLQSITDLQSST